MICTNTNTADCVSANTDPALIFFLHQGDAARDEERRLLHKRTRFYSDLNL